MGAVGSGNSIPSCLSFASIRPLIAFYSVAGLGEIALSLRAPQRQSPLPFSPPRNRRIRSLAPRPMHKRAFAVLFLLLAPGAASPATLGEARGGFNADPLLVIDGRGYNGKIWAMPGKERHEQAIQAFRPVFILHADSPLAEAVLPELHTVVQFVMPPEMRVLGTPELEKHPVGQESVNGIAPTKYAIDETVPEGHATGTLWLSHDGIPMRLAGTFTAAKGKVSTVRWELSHVKIGPQPDNLFETPQGYSKLPAEAVAPLLGLRLKSA